MAEKRQKAGPPKGIVETRAFVEYVPAGVRVDPYEGNEPLLDPELEKARKEEVKTLAEVKVEPRGETTIDPELVKARDADLKEDAKRAKAAGLETRATKPESEPEPAAKKATTKSSSKKK